MSKPMRMMKHRPCRTGGCTESAAEPCFECGAWQCNAHLHTLHIPTYDGTFRERVCADCYQAHIGADGPFGPAILEQLPGDGPVIAF